MAENKIMAAVEQESLERVKELIAAGEPVDMQYDDGRTPLFVAVQKNNLPIAKALLDAGADPNVRDITMLTPWICAGANGFHEILTLMLNYNPDIKSINRFGGTVLLPSSEKGYLPTVQVAIRAGVPVNHQNKFAWSGLQEAVILGNGGFLYSDIIRTSIQAGADPLLKDYEGKTAMDWARGRGETHVVELLTGSAPAPNYAQTRAAYEAGDYEGGLAALKEDSLEALYLKGYGLTLLHRLDEALEVYRAGAKDANGLEFLFYSANVLRTMKRVDEALAEYDRAIAAKPDYFFFRYHQSNYYRELGMHEQAVRSMDILLSQEPKRYDYMFHKANSLRSLGRHQEALDTMELAIPIVPENPLFRYNKAQSLVLLGRYAQAVEVLQEVVAMSDDAEYAAELARVKQLL